MEPPKGGHHTRSNCNLSQPPQHPKSTLVDTCMPLFAQKSSEVHLFILVACIILSSPQFLPSQRHFREKIFKIAWKLRHDCPVIDSNSGKSDSELSLSFLPLTLTAKEGFQGIRLYSKNPHTLCMQENLIFPF